MKKLFTLILLAFSGIVLRAQDISVISIQAPVSGCALTATENVTIRIFNYGPTLTAGSSFNVSYTINGGPPVTELLTLGSNLLSNSTLNYTFTTQANLSVPGSYTFAATCNLVGDVNPSNNSFGGYVVTNTAPSVGGTITGPSSVCLSGNSGNLTLSGHTGNVLRWEYSTDGGFTWINVTNTSTTQPYNNLTVPTQYRAVVQSGGCTPAFSTPISIAIDNPSVGGTLSPGSNVVCISSNSGVLTLSGRTGTIIRWEFSTDGGVTWTNIANTAATYTYIGLTQTTQFRVLVQNASCSATYSSIATVTVSPASVGGSIAPAVTSVCAPTNSGTLTLSGHTGAVNRWEFSTDGGVTWTAITNTTTTLNFTNLTVSRLYRARIISGTCSPVFSATAAVNVIAASVGGTITPASATVCSGANSGTLTLGGNVGNVVQWESSINGGVTWSIITNTTTSQSYTNLTTTTLYRALVQSSGCTAAYSSISTITVSPTSVGGTTATPISVCSGSNSGSVNLTGQTGSITRWEFSTDGGLTWNAIANTTTTQSFTNLTQTTMYQVIVQSGVCPADTSGSVTITVDPVTAGGTTLPANDTVCSGANSGTITLSGNVGNVIRWELSTDNGLTWISIGNTTTSQTYNNINTYTLYRAVVQSGTCAQAFSSVAAVTVDQPATGGTLYGSTTACSGSNSGTITLIGAIGTISNWESSSDNGVTWTPIANNTTSLNFLNLTDTTLYRVIVTNGVCNADTSTLATILIDEVSLGGTVTVDDTVCSGANSGFVTLSGHRGVVDGWEFSTDGGFTWINISNSTTTQNFLNLTATTMYRARVQNGVCSPVNSSFATITVDPPATGGTVTGSTTVCASGNSGSLQLTGYSGSIVSWETSADGLTWAPNGNTTATESYTNLADTTWYRVIVSSGVCGSDTSSMGSIIVDPATVAGAVTMNDTVCSGSNSGTIYLNGQTGAVTGWQYSTDGMNWIALANTADSLNYANLLQTTYYQAVVQSGVCPSQFSSMDTITVTTPATAGTITGSTPGCEGANAGTLILSGYNGSITGWQVSTDGGATWTPIANTTASQTYLNLTDTTWYNAIVSNGACAADTSAPIMVVVYPKPAAAFTTANNCFGTATAFTNTSTVSAGGIQFNNWDFGNASNSISVSPSYTYAAAGTYNVVLIATSNFGCSDTVTNPVTVYALPVAQITSAGASPFCLGDTLTLSVPMDTLHTYLWNTGSTQNSIQADTTGNYVVTVTDTATGCTAMDSVALVALMPPVADAGLDSTIGFGQSIVLNGSGGNGASYDWTPYTGLNDHSIAAPTATPVSTITYTLLVTAANGCSDTDQVTITLIQDYNLLITNLITANADGHNDTWVVQGIENYPNNEVHIYNRNGMEVFTEQGYHNEWNATYNGQQVPDGTYIYIIKFTDSDVVLKGAVTVISSKD
jgi:gliding motility-associated-like protein